MGFKAISILGFLLLFTAAIFATPLTSPMPNIMPNSDGWLNQNVEITLSVSAPVSDTNMVTYYTLDMNLDKTPLPNIVYSGPITLTQNNSSENGKASIRFFTSAKIDLNDSNSGLSVPVMADDNEQQKYYFAYIDTTPPANSFLLNNGSFGINCDLNGRIFDCNLNNGIISIPGTLGLGPFADSGPSGLANCRFNFDYNALAPTENWGQAYNPTDIPSKVNHTYASLGEKIAAIKCIDMAGNSSTSLSTVAFKLTVTGLDPILPSVSLAALDSNKNPILANANGWFNQNLFIRLNASDPDWGIKEIRYCILDSNKYSDGCRATNPDYNKFVFGSLKTIPKDPIDYNIFTSDLSLKGDGNFLVKYYSVNNQDANSGVITSYILNDMTLPANALGVADGTNGITCVLVGKNMDCNLSTGKIVIPGPVGLLGFSDIPSGIDYCEFDFDYDSNSPVWEAPIFAIDLNNGVSHQYSTLGDKNFAMKCVDLAGNQRVSTSAPVYKLTVTGLPPAPVIITNTGGGGGVYHPPAVDNNMPLDTNVPIDVNAPLDVNAPVDVNAPGLDNNTPLDTNALISPNITAGDINSLNANNPSPATGFFGLFGNGDYSGLLIPGLVILLAVMLILLGIKMGGGAGAVAAEGTPKKKFAKK